MTTTTWDAATRGGEGHAQGAAFPVRLRIDEPAGKRNRLTSAFRLLLALPHLILVGGPMAAVALWGWESQHGEWGAGGGLLGAVAGGCAVIAWFAILFTGRHPEGLWSLAAFYLRWRTRAVAYTALLVDDYPPFGEGAYPVELLFGPPAQRRDRVRVAFRVVLALPHLVLVCLLSLAWGLTSVIAWLAILFTGRYPRGLYRFAVGVLRWNLRVESYLLLLHDAYPPFSLA